MTFGVYPGRGVSSGVSNCFPWEEIVGAEIVAAQAAGKLRPRKRGGTFGNFMRIVDISEHVSDIATAAGGLTVRLRAKCSSTPDRSCCTPQAALAAIMNIDVISVGAGGRG